MVAALNTVSAWYHVLGVLVLVGAVMLFAQKQPLTFLLSDAPPLRRRGDAAASSRGCCRRGWTFTGYDASAHVSEETKDAGARRAEGHLDGDHRQRRSRAT